MHLERPFLPILPPCRQAADISAAHNLNNSNYLSMYIFICTYITVRKMFLQEHFVEIVDMFLQEHFPAQYRHSAPQYLSRLDGRRRPSPH
jgi:hypothetical protein